MSRVLWCCPLAVALLSGCNGGDNNAPGDEGGVVMQVTSSAFKDGDTIPKEYTSVKGARNVSPPLRWAGAPDGVKSVAVICDDPDAPRGTWVHWVLFDLPPDTTELAEGFSKKSLPEGAVEGKNDFRAVGYDGPNPPAGKPHHYHFKVYALDATLGLKEGATKADVEKAMKGHVKGHGELVGLFGV
jgi:Raf kinase inhibitor-like YbhB/YbcL family protein